MTPRRWLHLLAFAGLLAAWTYALLSPVPEGATEVLGDDGAFLFGKTLHVSVYAAIMALGGTLWLMRGKEGWLAAILVTHGALTEYFQQFVGRHMAVRDVLFDAMGVFIGSGIVAVWLAIRRGATPGAVSTQGRGLG